MNDPNVKWRRSRYWCRHAVADESGVRHCHKNMCSLPVLIDCCVTCIAYEGKDRGLGDTIKRATKALGIPTCGKCQKRREALNKLTGKLYGADEHVTDH